MKLNHCQAGLWLSKLGGDISIWWAVMPLVGGQNGL